MAVNRQQPNPAPSAAQIQRAVFVAVLSFLFFLAMMLAFYLRQSILYFLLATAFLFVYIVTMISFVRLRRSGKLPPGDDR
ncbi:MAG: hypothetical protein ACKVQW_13110 [Pyrinomonadaceae bacterium]